MSDLEDLSNIFRKLGAREPESWAASQIEEGINQLARFVFLREAWKSVIDERDDSWIDGEIRSSKREPEAPGAGMGKALENLLSAGGERNDIVQIARHAQWKLLFELCYLLEGPDELEDEIKNMSWGLFEVGESGDIVGTIDGLHESVLDTEPTGREMRPQIS